MSIKDLLSAALTCILILGASLGSNALLDRYLPSPLERQVRQNSAAADQVATAPGGGACVDASGRWVNWPWANVPALSPPCPTTSPKPAEPAEQK